MKGSSEPSTKQETKNIIPVHGIDDNSREKIGLEGASQGIDRDESEKKSKKDKKHKHDKREAKESKKESKKSKKESKKDDKKRRRYDSDSS